MIVDDFHVKGISRLPVEADAPLLIDSDTVLTRSITGKRFEPICRRDTKVNQISRMIKHSEFVKRALLNLRGQMP